MTTDGYEYYRLEIMNFDSLYKEYSDYKYELDRAAEMSRRKSWNDVDHVRVIKDASYDLSMESLVANATRVRYEVEKWKERNPESYENFLNIVRLYNNAALAGTAFSAILSAPETGGVSLLTFGLGASLLAGIEVLADFIAEESADKIAQYCAKGDKAKESSYLKTCDFIIQFAAENGLIAAGRVKILKESGKKVGDRYPRNAEYADSHHLKTKIPFNEKGFPVFDSVKVCDLKIEGDLKSMRADTHKRLATQKLRDMIERGEFDASVFNEKQLKQIMSCNKKVDGYTWHHHEDYGRMQLVPEKIHKGTGHTGGDAIWGSKSGDKK